MNREDVEPDTPPREAFLRLFNLRREPSFF